MKRFIYHLILTVLSISAFPQSNTKSSGITTLLAESEGLGMEKHIWGHARYKTDNSNKRLIDFDAINNWIRMVSGKDVAVSNDGKYFSYAVTKVDDVLRKSDTLILQSTFDNWRKTFTEVKPGFFVGDNQTYVCYNEYKLQLCFVKLGKEQPNYLKDVVSYKVPIRDKIEFLAYQLKNNTSIVVLLDLINGKEKRFDNVASYKFDPSSQWLSCEVNSGLYKNDDKELIVFNLNTNYEKRFRHVNEYVFNQGGNSLLLKIREKSNSEIVTSLCYVDLLNGALHSIWSTTDTTIQLDNFSFDALGKQMIFVITQKDKSIWYWKEGMDKGVNVISDQTPGMDPDLMLQGSAAFTDNNRYIQIELQPRKHFGKLDSGSVAVDVWSHKDTIIQSSQPVFLKKPKSYAAVFNPKNGKLIQLETVHRRLKYNKINGDYAVILQSGSDIYGDRFWEKDYYQDSCWVISLHDETCKYVGRANNEYQFSVSPSNKYLVFADYEKGCNYYNYNFQTGKLINISIGVPRGQFYFKWSFRKTHEKYAVGLAGWLDGDEGVMVYDNSDIWLLDLTGNKHAKNITNGYGKRCSIDFAFMNSDRDYPQYPIFNKKDTLLLRAFNRQNKNNGYYRMTLNSNSDPELLFMGPCFFERLLNHSSFDPGMHPLKANETKLWIVQRQTPTEAANYYLTTDFKQYKQLTNLQPHLGYNWLTRELHSFKKLDGTISQGVLSKPENFDPQKKYPVIIAFYGSLSDQLYQYPNPEFLDDASPFDNPALLVSQGYLLFTPDVCFTTGQWGPSTVNVVDGAARYLSQLPYVDGHHIAACGHSNSGSSGYYVLTHSGLFAAMTIGAGAADAMSRALSIQLNGNKGSELELYEVSGFMTGMGNFWKNKETWLDHTSVLNADKATSPLLIFHCEKDANPVRMAIEMFISLRRLEKPVWWLQYDKGVHTLPSFRKREQQDFTIRTIQFYDHYLKGAPAPRWMTRGIPFSLKGIEARYELDPSGSCGKVCLVCKAWNQQCIRTPSMFTSPLGEWKMDEDLRKDMEKDEGRKYKINIAKHSLKIKNTVKRLSIKPKK